MMWAIELTIGFMQWRERMGGPDDQPERLRWVKLCHRLGSEAALRIVDRHQRVDKMSNR